MEKLSKPQIICHIEKSVDYSLFDTKWIPCSAKFVVMGSRPRGTGIIQIYEVSSGELKHIKDIERSNPVKCGTFNASSLRDRHLAVGDFKVHLIELLVHCSNMENLIYTISKILQYHFIQLMLTMIL